MSTTYGKVLSLRGRPFCIEAYGATFVVKLEWPDGTEIIALDSLIAVDGLIVALEAARDHVWGRDTA
jgi:hypothetical protein